MTAQRILVIDDEAAIGDLITAAAEGMGLDCTALTSARQLGEKLDSAIAAVIIDLMMPDMDGIELVRKLAEGGCRAPVVLMSGHDRSVLRTAEDMARSLGLRTAGPLHKPFRIADVELLLTALAGPPKDRRSAGKNVAAPLEESELLAILRERAIEMHYQPQIELDSDRVAGVEALVRLRHPAHGIVYPDQFISLTEGLGLMDELTTLVLEQSLRDFARRTRLADATLSLNVSATSLTDLTLPDRVAASAEQAGVPLSRVIVEITESGLIQEFGKALDILARLRLRGAGISIDDFGTGYSSMAQLRRMPCTELKIDRMFVNDMLNEDSSRAVVEQSIGLAHRLGLKVVAEGVENAPLAQALADAGCDLAQGYFYARPLAAVDLDTWLDSRAAT